MSSFRDANQVKVAFRMLLEGSPLGMFAVRKVDVASSAQGGHAVLKIVLNVPNPPENHAEIAQNFVGFENWLKRTCFEFYMHRGILVEPKPVLLEVKD